MSTRYLGLALTDFKIGEQVDYILPHGYLRGTIVNITAKRLVLRFESHRSTRNTVPAGVRKVETT